MAQRLENKVAVITGASKGMAFATAQLFAQEGAFVFIMGRSQKELDEAVTKIGTNAIGVQGDAGNMNDLDRLYAVVKKEKGHVDIVFASAGVGEFNVPIGTITEEGFHKIFDLNVKGTLFTVQKALPLMRNGGSVILNGSIGTLKAFEGLSVYNASKAAVRSFARTWTVELKQRNIRVNVLSPGAIDTGVYEGVPQPVKDYFISQIPMGRMGRPEEIAKVALFLASDDSSFITGIELFVDGGTAQI